LNDKKDQGVNQKILNLFKEGKSVCKVLLKIKPFQNISIELAEKLKSVILSDERHDSIALHAPERHDSKALQAPEEA